MGWSCKKQIFNPILLVMITHILIKEIKEYIMIIGGIVDNGLNNIIKL